MESFAEIDIIQNGDYLKLLSAVSKLSGLFSESSIPFINYRVAENIFCRCLRYARHQPQYKAIVWFGLYSSKSQ